MQKNNLSIIGCSGHRKLNHNEKTVKMVLSERLLDNKADAVITGMALGFDLLVAETCIENNIPFIAAVPCMGQTKKWKSEQKEKYIQLMEKAWKHTVVTPGSYAVWKLFKRNEWIVNRSSKLICYWNSNLKGGTHATIAYAKKQQKPWENIFDICEHKEKT